MSVEVVPLTREPTLEGQGAQKTVGQAVAFPPRRGWGTPHRPQLHQEMPGKRRKGSAASAERGMRESEPGATMEDHWL